MGERTLEGDPPPWPLTTSHLASSVKWDEISPHTRSRLGSWHSPVLGAGSGAGQVLDRPLGVQRWRSSSMQAERCSKCLI